MDVNDVISSCPEHVGTSYKWELEVKIIRRGP